MANVEDIMSCRPVDWSDHLNRYPEHTNLPVPTIQPGSVVTKCAKCEVDVYLGPRQQGTCAAFEFLNHPYRVFCFACCLDTGPPILTRDLSSTFVASGGGEQ